jgi:HlyD family secretion protein
MIEVREVAVSPKLSGIIKEMRAIEGEPVATGDTLAILEHRELLAQREEAGAGLVVAEQTLREIMVQRENLEKNVGRLRQLHDAGDIPDKELENIETQLAALIAQEDKAAAGISAARARLNLVRMQLDNAYITSPAKGIVLARNFEAGEFVYPGAELLSIGDLESAWLKIYIAERDIGRITLGCEANVYVDAYPKEFFKGRVSWISSEAEFTPKNIQTRDDRAGLVFAVKIAIPNLEQKLLPGMPADAQIMSNGSR